MSATQTEILRSAQNDKKREPRVTGVHPRVMMDGQHTIMKLCGKCQTQMPHKVGAGTCILCELDADVITSGQDDHHG
jgi:hypothetical protein